MKKAYTTGDVARICRVTINTVVKWFDSGELEGYRIPSSRARRVLRKALLDFMKKHSFPMDEIASENLRILAVDDDTTTLSLFRRAFSDRERYLLKSATSAFEAGLQALDFAPDVVFFSVDLGNIEARRVAEVLRSNEETANTTIVAMSKKLTQKRTQTLRKQGFAEVLIKPLKSKELREIANKYAQ
jgi:PleD family two-component response regulator